MLTVKVISRAEFVAAMTTSSGTSLWGTRRHSNTAEATNLVQREQQLDRPVVAGVFSPEAAAALFKEMDFSRTGKITKAKFGQSHPRHCSVL